ncbi:hypothetical protein CHS0354_015171 [Potamilus streckersoni]|uniref:NFX1-type zinc finger-containing protein 1 n=1 Tax=Potamilus streckersoni TaxID=2493646 RepID=A0AAE0VUI3_9BIVA|nr:hypothetical protein CHS0354_015171 [Potamilus streckersoni]
MEQIQLDNVRNFWSLNYEDRWCLYRYWRQRYINELEDDFVRQAELCEDAMKMYKEAKIKEDGFILQQADIIGMTTTCAVRYQPVLQEIGPRIIIVEEAAEILESHVITTLSEHCQHLILIGDHEQLRPNPATYTLAKDYKLDISLFERMVNNGIQCDCLEEQHRMRPEISMLLQHIYRNLRDHESLAEYEHIRGVGSNIFFIDHTQEELPDADQKSHLNKHEARYVAALCKYLLRQGYSPNQITVLTTYYGQLFCLNNMMTTSDFNGVKVTVVDNYQGEEKDIILLSLVRSNREGRIGFLKISNRICVALSRAKKGFYVIGNFSFLARHSELWRNIVETLKTEKRLGEALTLHCQNHLNDGFKAVFAQDFKTFAPEGGCKKDCKTRCKFPMTRTLPICGHTVTLKCCDDIAGVKCPMPYKQRWSCGHVCQRSCGEMHTTTCLEVLEEILECGHKIHIQCYESKFKEICTEKCTLPLTCGHTRHKMCGKSMITINIARRQ